MPLLVRSIYNATTNTCEQATQQSKEESQNLYRPCAMRANLARLCSEGRLKEAMGGFHEINQRGIPADPDTHAYLLQACANLKSLEDGKYVHTHILKSGFEQNAFVGAKLINMYVNCGSLLDARLVFEKMQEPNIFSWNWMIRGCIMHGKPEEALILCYYMRRAGIQPDNFAIPFVLNACASLTALKQGKEIHNYVIRTSFDSDIFVGSALIDMYAKCGNPDFARHVFDKMSRRNEVSWNALIAGYAQNGNCDEALELFRQMQIAFLKPNLVTWNALIAGHVQNGHADEALKLFRQMQVGDVKPNSITIASVLPACASLADIEQGKEIHDYAIRSGYASDVFVGSALIDMYAKCWRTEFGRQVFDKMCQRNVVSWNVLIAGYVQKRNANEALKLFRQMQLAGMKPNLVTVASVLPACGQLAALQQGKEIHDYIIRLGFENVVFVGNAVVDMYAKCGSLVFARHVFDKMPEKDVVSWTAMIVGYGMHGHAMEALTHFHQMQQAGTKPNHITFVGVLSSCSHAGLVDEGWRYFDSMYQDYHIEPRVEHYACMVDLLGRAQRLDEAYNFIENMPLEPSAGVWGALLGACRIHCNIELAECVAECLFQLEPENAGNYILLSNIYAQAGRWHDAAKVRKAMKEKTLKKRPGCSWIEVNNRFHAFLVGDISHPQSHKIYAMLDC
eukprot:Gb_39962 [translate_table: standard]